MKYVASLLESQDIDNERNPRGRAAPNRDQRIQNPRNNNAHTRNTGTHKKKKASNDCIPPPKKSHSQSSHPLNRARPSQSKKSSYHCEACNCDIPFPIANWHAHIAGVRHQRQLLSLREHGQRNTLVLSIFESHPSNELETHRAIGSSKQAAKDFGLLHDRHPRSHQKKASRRDMDSPSSSSSTGLVRSIINNTLASILCKGGRGLEYSKAAAVLGRDNSNTRNNSHSNTSSRISISEKAVPSSTQIQLQINAAYRQDGVHSFCVALRHLCRTISTLLADTFTIQSIEFTQNFSLPSPNAPPMPQHEVDDIDEKKLSQVVAAEVSAWKAACGKALAAVKTALAMSRHPRLGQHSPLGMLPLEVLEKIVGLVGGGKGVVPVNQVQVHVHDLHRQRHSHYTM